jgi:dolichyl-diphosphooligosaccharide--protein glycosyltransferase
LVSEGFYEFWNWFDSDSWYPLGRVVGGTVYPGIMITAATVYKLLTKMTAWVQLRDVCVLTGPFFAGNTVRGKGGRGVGAVGRQPGGWGWWWGGLRRV